ncbi:nucleotidyltransferase [Fictibacillus iocasae]|uniref:tRNA(Met) cytidine acetate ligase n=1 Tax=Fictibacillus iocasae TaxID=2715437 RepID=A0ABW2NS60_9BACL
MNACGVVVEHNPFHNGHYYHLQEARKQTGADCIIACMSGNFLQRGEPAILSKWIRTEMALLGGADLVIELPYPFATSHAERFAFGSISLLEAAGAETFCFGSESGKLDDFLSTMKEFERSHNQLDSKISSYMNKGFSYPKSNAMALTETMVNSSLDMSAPNNILGFEYVKAARLHGLAIKPHTIKRINANYHDTDLGAGNIASATAIRKALFTAKDTIRAYIPETTASLMDRSAVEWHSMSWERLYPYFKYKVLTATKEKLCSFYQVEEGLENRIMNCVKKAETFEEYMTLLKTKRYTWTRLQRASLHIFADAGKEQMKSLLRSPPPYLRVLGMSETGRKYISHHKKLSPLPIITTLSKYSHKMLDLEVRTSSAYYHIAQKNRSSSFNEYAQHPVFT